MRAHLSEHGWGDVLALVHAQLNDGTFFFVLVGTNNLFQDSFSLLCGYGVIFFLLQIPEGRCG